MSSFSRLKRVDDWTLRNWVINQLQLPDSEERQFVRQMDQLLENSPFVFYERKQIKKRSFLWRATLPVFLLFYILLLIITPIKWFITGNRYLPQKFIDDFFHEWMERMGLV